MHVAYARETGGGRRGFHGATTADGWDRVFLGETYFFDQGLVEITEGMTLTDVTTVKQLVDRILTGA